jgi:hypothetical protein
LGFGFGRGLDIAAATIAIHSMAFQGHDSHLSFFLKDKSLSRLVKFFTKSIFPGHGAAALGALNFPAGHARLVGNPVPAGRTAAVALRPTVGSPGPAAATTSLSSACIWFPARHLITSSWFNFSSQF